MARSGAVRPGMGVAIPAPKSSRRRATSRTLEGSRAAPAPAVPAAHPRCPPRNPSPKSSLDAPKDLGLLGSATGRRVRRLFRQYILDFECRKRPPTTTAFGKGFQINRRTRRTRRRSRWGNEFTGSGPFRESPEAARSIAGFQIFRFSRKRTLNFKG